MNNLFSKASVQIPLTLLVTIALIYGIWSYVASFQTVIFEFDNTLGYMEIAGSDGRPLFPINDQPVRLKKGKYTVQNIGENIAKNTQSITIDSDTDIINVPFSYTDRYLATLYDTEREDIYATLIEAYPQLTTTYDIRHDQLYRKGDVFAATLTAKNQDDDNADTLRLLMQKKSGNWMIRSTPPQPILSAPVYSDIPRSILLKINSK